MLRSRNGAEGGRGERGERAILGRATRDDRARVPRASGDRGRSPTSPGSARDGLRRGSRTSGRYPEAGSEQRHHPRACRARCFADASPAPRPSARRSPVLLVLLEHLQHRARGRHRARSFGSFLTLERRGITHARRSTWVDGRRAGTRMPSQACQARLSRRPSNLANCRLTTENDQSGVFLNRDAGLLCSFNANKCFDTGKQS